MTALDIFHELQNVSIGYPVSPSTVLDTATAEACEGLGWTERDNNGDWIPTMTGVRVLYTYHGTPSC